MNPNPYDVQFIIQTAGVEAAVDYLMGLNASRRLALQYIRAWSYMWPEIKIPEE